MNETNLNPMVSIIVPTYNPCQYLAKTLSSIYVQDYKNIEVIVVDDCSDNGPLKYIRQLQELYKFKLHLLSENSGGCARPLNEGIKISSGEYIGVCAQDDFHLPEKTSRQVKYMETHLNFFMLFSDAYCVVGDDNSKYIKQKTPKRRSGRIFDDILLQRFYVPALSALIRREVFDAVGGFDENLLIEDWDMWLKIANRFEIGYLNIATACYRSHSENISKKRFDQMKSDRITIINKWKNKPVSNAALKIANFLDEPIRSGNIFTFCKNSLATLWHTRQPIRWIRILVSKILKYNMNSKKK
jgi:glycosyltransferase involved in cell wall biosynthesis